VTAELDSLGGVCVKHYTERATGRCHDCLGLFCAECLVPPLSKRMPTRCVGCALVAAGVRAPGSRRREMEGMNRTTTRW